LEFVIIFDNMISCNHLLLIILAGGCLGSEFCVYNPDFHGQFFLPLPMEATLKLSFSSLSVMQIWIIMLGLVPGHLLGAAKPIDPISMCRPPVIMPTEVDSSRASASVTSLAAAERDKGEFAWGGQIRG
jgi:hypothetical protein